MKVVLFCGGLGTRIREFSDTIPKPMVTIGYRPILWHVMKYYAHYGHAEFILCLGYRGDAIRDYFSNYHECGSTDVVRQRNGRERDEFGSDIEDWKITFIDTGLHASVGQRLRAVERHLEGEEVFLANYTDGLSDLALPRYLEHFRRHHKVASFLCVRPTYSFHVASVGADGLVEDVRPVAEAGLWINGGFFVFTQEIFGYLREGEDLVEEPFRRLIARGQLVGYGHRGFWRCMDTFKDKQALDEMSTRGDPPWEVWKYAERTG